MEYEGQLAEEMNFLGENSVEKLDRVPLEPLPGWLRPHGMQDLPEPTKEYVDAYYFKSIASWV